MDGRVDDKLPLPLAQRLTSPGAETGGYLSSISSGQLHHPIPRRRRSFHREVIIIDSVLLIMMMSMIVTATPSSPRVCC